MAPKTKTDKAQAAAEFVSGTPTKTKEAGPKVSARVDASDKPPQDALLRAKYGDQEALRPRKEKKRRRQAEASARAPDARVEAAQAGWKRRWGVLRSRGERTEAEDGGEGCKLRRIVQRSRKARRVVEDDEED